MRVHRRFSGVVAITLAAMSLVACSADQDPIAPSALGQSAFTTGVTRDYFEVPISFEGPLDWVTCIDPNDPPLAHVNGTLTFDVVTTSSGITSTRSYFIIDRANTWVIYQGVTYYLAPGRIGKDDIAHILEGPGALYVEAGVEPDFLASGEPGQRLRLNFHWQIVIDPNGNARVVKSTGSCPSL